MRTANQRCHTEIPFDEVLEKVSEAPVVVRANSFSVSSI
jgi:hypothetical protein